MNGGSVNAVKPKSSNADKRKSSDAVGKPKSYSVAV
jgi:hypothetical protein